MGNYDMQIYMLGLVYNKERIRFGCWKLMHKNEMQKKIWKEITCCEWLLIIRWNLDVRAYQTYS
jgi:hypothetical protein